MRNSFRSIKYLALAILIVSLSSAEGQVLSDEYLRIGVSYGSNFGGDEITRGIDDYSAAPYAEIFIDMHLVDKLGLRLTGMWGSLANQKSDLRVEKYYELAFDRFSYETTFFGGMLGPAYSFDPLFWNIQPTLFVRAGVLRKKTSYFIEDTETRENWNPVLVYGFGASVNIPVTNVIALNFSYSGNFVQTDMLDGFDFGFKDDGFSTFSAGISMYLFGGQEEELYLPREFEGLAANEVQGPSPPVEMLAEPTPDDEEINWTLQADKEFFKSAELIVETNEFTSFAALHKNPRDLRISSSSDRSFPSPLLVDVEFIHKGNVIARGKKRTFLPQGTMELNATDLIDFDALEVDPDYIGELPKGDYVIRLSVQPETRSEMLAESSPFQVLKLNQAYGDSAYKVQQLIETSKLEALFTEDNQMIMSTYAVNAPFMQRTSAVNKEIWTGEGSITVDEASEEGFSGDVDFRGAATIIPEGLTDLEAETYLRTLVAESFENADRIKSMESYTSDVPVIVVELFYAFDDADVGRENQIILNQVAKEINRRPEYNLELRGYADDVGEKNYNLFLSKERAEKARAYLLRNVNPGRVDSEGFGKIRYVPIASPEWRQRARKVEILLPSSES
jgi:outer membrane protein OmpA-like peptidoglycan-associated protein